MTLTKTQLRIMQVFASKITTSFSIRQVAHQLGIDYSLAHRSLKPLINKHKLLKETDYGQVILNFRKHHDVLSYVEYLRRNSLLNKKKYKDLSMCFEHFIKDFTEESFVLLLFGSIIEKDKPRDIDVLLIVDNIDKTESAELFLHNVSRNYTLDEKLHIVCVSFESVYEMLGKREQRNVINEALNKHIIVHGAELFYRLLNRGRQ